MLAILKVFAAPLALVAVLVTGVSAQANEYRCFGDDQAWCAWTIPETTPEKGWGAINKTRLRSLVLETVIDARNNMAALRVHVSPVTPDETVSVNLSLREAAQGWQDWGNFVGNMQGLEETSAHFLLDRTALEAVIEASNSASLYVFVEVANGGRNHKVSHKIPLAVLQSALQFARMGE